MGIINIPKSITIRALHSFGVGTNPIGWSYPIDDKILSLAVNGPSDNAPQDMVLPREVFHKTSIQVPNKDDFEHKLINTQSFPLFKNANLHHKEIIIKVVPINTFLFYGGFNADIDSVTIYRQISTLDSLNRPVV